jgi:dipeptidyl aminopeptidase/acylaminoacyl peptidase
MKQLFLIALMFICIAAQAQKKTLDHDDFDIWNRVSSTEVSPDGKIIVYHLVPGKGDQTMKIVGSDGKELATIPRAENSTITWDSKYVVFTIKPAMDSVRALKRIKTKDDKLPKDSLGIFNISTKTVEKYARVKSYKVPKEWPGMLTFQLEPELPKKEEKDSTKTDEDKPKPKKKKGKKVSKDNGYHLVVLDLDSKEKDTLFYVTDYEVSKRGANFIYHTSGKDSTINEGVYYYQNSNKNSLPLCRAKGKYTQLALSEDGLQAAFLADLDTTKALIRDYQMRYWAQGKDSALVVAKRGSDGLPSDWIVNQNGKVEFSRKGTRIFFGSSPEPIVQDTTLLTDEIIQVEIWNYQNGRLHTQQNIEADEDRKRSYKAYYNLMDEKIVQLGQLNIPEVKVPDHGDADYALGVSNLPYEKYISWEGYPRRTDLYSINLNTGKATLAKQEVRGDGDISAGGQYLYWYNAEDTTWSTYDNEVQKAYLLTDKMKVSLADELNDQPNYPYQYGAAGWTTGDQNFLIYDRYDIWKLSPDNSTPPQRLTDGRSSKTVYRNVDLNKEEEAIDPTFLLFELFQETDKQGGLASSQNLGSPKTLLMENAGFSGFVKADNAETIVYQKGNQIDYPDLYATNYAFKKSTRLSTANPQQSQYNWATVELVNWNSLDGESLEGLLYKPENFDPHKKYPMITYFYEKNSDNLNRHWGAVPIRSIVNPTFYASRGYLVFIPDITYKIGYPGESCYNDVIPGVTSLIEKGFVDKKRLGVQGHSWGGYQVAYLVTKTDLFAAAEAGAIVSNMISAYGGIRWWTGLSRMFQYEHTQSRIGGTLWEYPMRYIENSPIFSADKVNTPLLLMHNDADGHVPWYQGIEYYTALRRLGKPVWMLNYNGEPHWPTKYENIRDFNVRMSQFFDHYLKGAPQPIWMGKGVPAIEKGINKGYEPSKE